VTGKHTKYERKKMRNHRIENDYPKAEVIEESAIPGDGKPPLIDAIDQLAEKYRRIESRRDRAEERLDAVRALHVREASKISVGFHYCAHCDVPFPCPTIQAIDGVPDDDS